MVVCGEDEALHCAVHFYFRQRSFGRVYRFPVSVCRKPFVLIVSERERMRLGLSVKSAVAVLGDQPDDAEQWQQSKKYERLKTACEEAIRSLRHDKDV
jgi:hypothetical protein